MYPQYNRLRLQHVSFPQCISHYTPNQNIHPQCRCTRKKHYTPNRNIHPQCISQYTPSGYIHAQFSSNYTPNRNIQPQWNRLCFNVFTARVQCRVFIHKNFGKRHAHISMKSDCVGANTYRGSHSDVGCSGMTVRQIFPNVFFCNESMVIQYLKDIWPFIGRLDLELFF